METDKQTLEVVWKYLKARDLVIDFEKFRKREWDGSYK